MMTIVLHNIQCTAFHGVYAEERKIGNRFIVHVEVDVSNNQKMEHIQETINYEILHEVIRQHMKQPKQLLETVVQELAHYILNHFVQAQVIRIELTKIFPPIPSFNGSVSVKYEAKK